MFSVDNRFEVGQEVYVIKKEKRKIATEKTCDICFGKGIFDYRGYTINCPKCKTRGKIETDSRYALVFDFDKPHKITSIRYMVYEDINQNREEPLKYKIDGKFVPEKYIASTWEEAVRMCDELNIETNCDEHMESANHHYLLEE